MIHFKITADDWKIEQDTDLKMRTYIYGQLVEEWDGERLYSFDELYDILMKKTTERRSDDNADIRQ